MFVFKTLFAFLMLSSISPEEGWVSVPRPQRVPHLLEEEDHSIWVVFSKSFGDERILVRFPSDPIYQRKNGDFQAVSPYGGQGEFMLIVQKKTNPGTEGELRELAYPDPEHPGYWIQERHVESEENLYVLRFSNPVNNPRLFSQFANSFEIEKNSVFHR